MAEATASCGYQLKPGCSAPAAEGIPTEHVLWRNKYKTTLIYPGSVDLLIGLFCLACGLVNRGVVRCAFLLGAFTAGTEAFVSEDETPWLSWIADIVFYSSMARRPFHGRMRR
jgi:hypothetical protein